MRPILLNSCARAATAAEARFRIDAPVAPSRGVRVVALDPAAHVIAARLERLPWASARFFTGAGPGRLRRVGGVDDRGNGDGAGVPLDAELAGADVVVLVATSAAGADDAAAIGPACAVRGIMTAGLVLGGRGPDGGGDAQDAVTILRPHARVILVSDDETDVSEVLTALRA